MALGFQVKRGTSDTAPILESGELGFTTDTEKLLVGTGTKNIELLSDASIADELSKKEDVIDKKTAFNTDFGNVEGTVVQGGTVYTKEEVDKKIDDIETGSGENVDLSTIYTKTEIDGKLDDKENTFDKNTAFNKNFGTTADTVAQGNTVYTKTEIDQKFEDLDMSENESVDLSDYYTKTEIDTELNNKENTIDKKTAFNKDFGVVTGTVVEGGTVYSKSEIDTKLEEIETGSDVDLSSIYTKTEVDGKLLQKEDVITKNTAFNKNFGNETGMVVEGGTVYTKTEIDTKFEDLDFGSGSDVDLSNIYTKTEVDDKLKAKVDAISGKGLSTNDFTDALKEALESLENSEGSGDSLVTNTTVGYIKVGNVHSLIGDAFEDLDVFTLTFKALSDFEYEDKISYNEIEYDVYSGGSIATRGFYSGEVVIVNFDKAEQRCYMTTSGGEGTTSVNTTYLDITIESDPEVDVSETVISCTDKDEVKIREATFGTATTRRIELPTTEPINVSFSKLEGYVAPKDFDIMTGLDGWVITKHVQYLEDVFYLNLSLKAVADDIISGIEIIIKQDGEIIETATYNNKTLIFKLSSNTEYEIEIGAFQDYIVPKTIFYTSGESLGTYDMVYTYDVAYLNLTLTHSEGLSVANQKVLIADEFGEVLFDDVFGNTNPRRFSVSSNTNYVISFSNYEGCFALDQHSFFSGSFKNVTEFSTEYIYDIAYFDLTLTHSEGESVSTKLITIKDEKDNVISEVMFGNVETKRFNLLSNTDYTVFFEDYEGCFELTSHSFTTGDVKSVKEYSAEYVLDIAYFDLTLTSDNSTSVSDAIVTITKRDGTVISEEKYGTTTPKRYNLKSDTEYLITFGDLEIQKLTTPWRRIFTTNEAKSYQFYSAVYEEYFVYGICANEDESDPYESVIYTDDAVGMTPVTVDLTTGVPDYGSWKPIIDKMARPCILNPDGTVLLYLNRDNQNYDEDGNEVPYNTIASTCNYMVEMKKIYHRRWEVGNLKYYQCALGKWASDCRCHMWEYEDLTEHDCYYAPMYEGNVSSEKLRSFPNVGCTTKTTGTNEKTYAESNGSGYSLKPFVHWVHMCMMVYLLGKSLDSQATFGNGRVSASTINTGTLINKGAMHGYNTYTQQIKFLWQEGLWGNAAQRTEGMVLFGYDAKIKLHPPYNFEGVGYDDLGTYPAVTNAFFKNTTWTTEGIFPTTSGGSGTTNYCDGGWTSGSGVLCPLFGGSYTSVLTTGVFCVSANANVDYSLDIFGSSLHYKPPQT